MGDFDDLAEAALELGLTDLAEELKNTVQPTKEQVIEAARDFCIKYKDAEQIYQNWLNTQGRTKSSKRMKQVIQLQQVRESFDKFQNLINLYFHQAMLVMYVYMSPETGAVQLATTENSVQNLRINPTYGQVEYYLQDIKSLLFNLDDYDSTALDAAESSIYARWNRARQVCKKGRYLPILWYLGHWEGALVNNLGTIAEAYVNFYLNKYQFSGMLEADVKTYITNSNYGAMAVDNASGFLIGDVSYKGLHFAVKKQNASPMNLKKVYDEVNKILNDESFDLELLKDIFIHQEQQKAKHNQVKTLGQNLELTYSELIKNLERTI